MHVSYTSIVFYHCVSSDPELLLQLISFAVAFKRVLVRSFTLIALDFKEATTTIKEIDD